MEEEEEEISKLEDAVEGGEEEIYHDAVDEERGKRESSKDKGKEGDGASEIEVIKQIEVNPQRRNGTGTECNYYAIGPKDGDKNQATNGLQNRAKVEKGSTNGRRKQAA